MIKLARRVLCLDWDKRALRLVVARHSGKKKMSLEDAHSHRLPNSVDADDPQAMGEFIQQMLRRHRLRFKSVLVDVPRERAVINRLALPPTPDNEVAAAVRFQAMRELPFSVDSAAIDYVVTNRDEEGQAIEVLLAAVTNDTLDRVRATCDAAGLTPARIGLRPYANLVSLQHVMDLSDRQILLVDVGPGATEIDVFHGASLAFARSANVNIPLPDADSVTRDDSSIISLADVADLEAADTAIDGAVEELLVEVTRTLQAYRATEHDAHVDRVIVAGGTGIESQFAEDLERRLGYPVLLYDPTDALSVDEGEAAKLRSFSAALGLAWGLSREGMLALDFLNPKKPISARETMQRRVRAGVAAAVIVLGVVGGALGKWYWDLSTQYEKLRTTNANLREKLEDRQYILQQKERAEEWEVGAIWPEELLAISQAAVAPGKRMLVQAIDMESGRRHRIALRNLHAADFDTAMEFIDTLRSLEHDGEPVYEVGFKTWQEISDGQKFKGKIDVEITPVELVEHDKQVEQRERLRRKADRRRG